MPLNSCISSALLGVLCVMGTKPFFQEHAVRSAGLSRPPSGETPSPASSVSNIRKWPTLCRMLEFASLEELKTLFHQFHPADHPFDGVKRRVIMEVGMERYPRDWIAFLHGVNDDLAYGMYGVWARSNPEAALQAAKATEHEFVIGRVIEAIASRSPLKALELLASESLSDARIQALRQVAYEQLADSEFDHALGQALQTSSGAERYDRLVGLMKSWASRSPEDAWSWLDTHTQGGEQRRLRREVLHKAMATDHRWSWEITDSLPTGAFRQQIRSRLLDSISRANLNRAQEFIESLPAGRERNALLGTVLQMTNDPELLLEYAVTWHDGPVTQLVGSGGEVRSKSPMHVGKAIMEIAEEDPQAALHWLGRVGAHALPNGGIPKILRTWQETDADAALVWMAGMPAGSMRATVLTGAFDHAWTTNRDQAWTMLERLTPEARADLPRRFEMIAAQEPEKALQALDWFPSNAKTNAVRNIADQFALTDPQRALELLRDHTTGSHVGRTLQEHAAKWVAAEPETASQWIGGLERGPARDDAIAGLVVALISPEATAREIETAQAWIEEVEYPGLKNELQLRLAALHQAAPLETPRVTATGQALLETANIATEN